MLDFDLFKKDALEIYDNLTGLDARKSQRDMLSWLVDIVSFGGFVAAEAPTGTGKSLVMLVAAFAAHLQGAATTIATHSLVLQNQLARKEFGNFMRRIPRKLIPEHKLSSWRWGLLAGMSHYVCFRKLDILSDAACYSDLVVAESKERMTIVSRERLADLRRSEASPLKGLDSVLDRDDDVLRGVVSASRTLCAGKDCIFRKNSCPARLAARCTYPLTITNHGYLDGVLKRESDDTADTAEMNTSRAGGLFGSEILFLDEAHHWTGYSSNPSSDRSIEEADLKSILFSPVPAPFSGHSFLESIIESRMNIWESRLKRGRCVDDKISREFDKWERIVKSGRNVSSLWREDALQNIEKSRGMVEKMRRALKENTNHTGAVCEDEKSLERSIKNRLPRVRFTAFFSATLPEERIYSAETGTSLTSFLRFPSPLCEDTKTRVSVWIPQNAPSPSEDPEGHEAYLIDFCLDYIPDFISHNLGGVLVLCSSLKRKSAVASALIRDVVGSGGILLEQGKMSRSSILTTFASTKRSVLVASSSFREGFDAPGDNLTWVILDKLPFPRPDDPEFKRRARFLLDKGIIENTFDFSVSELRKTLCQSVGRLIRTKSDWGAVTVVDSRALTRGLEWGLNEISFVPREKWRVDSPPPDVWVLRMKSLKGGVCPKFEFGGDPVEDSDRREPYEILDMMRNSFGFTAD